MENVLSGPYREDTFGAFERLVNPDSICLDIGAYIGLTAMALTILATKDRVIAIEADKRNFAFLQTNIEANRFANITPLHHLVGAKGGQGMPRASRKFGLEETRMRSLSVDTIVAGQGLPRVEFIKIDGDGSEL
jgi:FkbM family methyltransferase